MKNFVSLSFFSKVTRKGLEKDKGVQGEKKITFP
jgi:hypothetical protein